MPEYLSNKKRKQSIGINSYSEYTDTTKIIGNVLVGFGSVGVGTTVPTQDVDVNTIRVRDTLFDYTNSGGEFGYYLVKDTDGIKWVAVPPIDSNAIFVAENNNILGVSSFTGLNIIADELLGVTPNPINPNFADITILPRWLKSGDTGIYTTKNVGIGTTIPTTDFQVGFGTTGVTIDGSVGVVSALGYYGNYAFIDQITVNDQLNVVGLGSTLVAAFLASAGGITTTGGDLYVGGSLFADKLDIINLKVVNIEATGITTLNVGIVSTFRVTGVSTLGVTSTADLFVDANLKVSGITTLGITSTKDLFVDENLYVVGIATATRFSTGATGSAINITSNTISGPAEIIIDPADIGDNSGIVRIKGDLYVDGEEFIVNSTTIELADFNVGIASTVGTNFLLDGAGIGIGSTNIRKTLTYDFSSDALKSSENFDLETGKVYKINETEVLSSTQLTVANINATGVSTLGFATIGQLYVSGVSTFVGVGTFIEDLYVGRNLYVADDIFFDELTARNANITGITTLNVGIVSTFRVTGVSTLGVTSTADLFVDGNLRVTGIATLGITAISQLNVSGITTLGVTSTTNLTSQQLLVTGITTLGITSTTNLTSQQLNVSGITTLGVTSTTNLTSQQLRVTGITTLGIATISQLYVSGVSTFVGVGTFSGNLYVSDILYADVISGLTSTTDLLVDGNLRVTGITTLGITSISQLNVSGITTLGITSTTNLTSQQLNVSGITTLGITSTTNLTSQQLNVSGISTLGVTTISQLYVSGVSTFVGVGTFSGDLYVGGILYADTVSFDSIQVENIEATGISTLNVGIVSSLTVTGLSTLGVTSTTDLLVDGDLRVTGVSTFVGFSTFNNSVVILDNLLVSGITTLAANGGITTTGGNLYVGGDLYVADDLVFDEFTARNAKITGIGTIETLDTTTGTIDYLTGTNLSYSGISTLGVTSTTNLTSQQLNVTGITTLRSIVGTSLSISGISTLGITSTTNLTSQQLRVTGITTLASIVGTSLSISGISTLGITSTTNLTSQQLRVTGITTLGVTTITQLYVSGVSTFSDRITGIISTATKLETPRTFEITGDVVASPIFFDGTGNVSFAATIQPNSVGLGTDTFGDYVKNITGTANQITVTGGTGEGSTPILSIPNQFNVPQDLIVIRDVQINRDLNVSGNITVGGTAATLFTQTFKVYDADIILGVRTDGNGNDISKDNSANHGGIAIASTEGNPLIILTNQGIGETLPATYKKIMWFKEGSFAGLGTDAWLSNYALGVGTTELQAGTVLAAGSVQFSKDDLKIVRNINASGIITATEFRGTLTGYASSAGIATNLGGGPGVVYQSNIGITSFVPNATENDKVLLWNGSAPVWGSVSAGSVTGTTDYANKAGIATYATNAGIATNLKGGLTGNIPYQLNPDITTFVDNSSATSTQVLRWSGSAPYWGSVDAGSITGVATYADRAGIADNVIGGIASVSQLNVSGITTLGITSTTNLTSQQLRVTGITTLANIVGTSLSITGISTIANFIMTPVGTGATVGGIGVVTYYGDGSGLTKINSSAIVGVATYADRAGITTNVIGGIGSITQLQVSGISTFTNGPILVGSATSTGTLLQRLQVTGGAYVSGNLGVGTTNPTSRLTVQGDVLVSGILTASRIVGTSLSITGISTIANFRITNVGTGATVGGIGVTYYGDGSQLINISSSSIVGIITYADNSGIATNVIGGIASVTSLNVTGISTLGSVEISSGIVTAKAGTGIVTYYGDGSKLSGVSAFSVQQQDIITSPVYPTFASNIGTSSLGIAATELVYIPASGNLGIGTTTPTSKLTVVGDVLISGVLTATRLYSGIYGEFVGGSISGSDIVGTSLSITGISTLGTVEISSGIITSTTGVVTYYGDGSNLTNVVSTSGYADSAGIATYADYAGISTNVIGGIASVTSLNVTGISTLGSVEISSGIITATTGIVTYYGDGSGLTNINLSAIVGVVTYVDKAGIATYADYAGISTNVIGGIASVTSLDVSGITTLGTVEISSGIITSTTGIVTYYGDGSQLTDVVSTSGYADNSGIATNVIGGIASVTSLDVSGISTLGVTSTTDLTSQQLNVTGITTLRSIVGTSLSITGISTIANFRITNVGTGATVGGIGVVTYYGDGSQLENIAVDYADRSGIATNVIGGIASVSQLNVTGITTLGITSISQLNVSGITTLTSIVGTSLSISGITTLGVTSTTNLTSQQLNVTGITTLRSIVGTSLSISGISTIANFIITPVGTGATVGGIGVVTYYGDGSGLTNINLSSVVGVVTYAERAGIATNVIGGIASVTSLNVTGITTLGITSISQLNVSGITTLSSIVGTSLSISGITTLGVTSTTNLTSQQLNVTGIATLASIVGTSLSITGISTIANFIITNVGTGATVGGVGVVTYYGDGSGLTKINSSAIVGVTTYADRAGIATNVIGGIASVSQLQVSGISTFTNGPILVGSATSTGTTAQLLQVTGGAYVSGNLGIGTTNPTSKLTVQGDVLVSGVLTARNIVGTSLSISGISTIANFIITNVGTGATVGGIGVVTYYGDGSNLSGVSAFSVQQQEDITASPIYPTFASNIGVSSISIVPTQVAYIPASGNLGIGTTTPTSKLTVQGDVLVSGVLTAASFSGTASTTFYTSEWILGANGSNDYTFTGPGFIGNELDPTLYVTRGERYKFTNTMNAHPFRIQSTPGTSGTPYNDGIVNNGVSNGKLTWDVRFNAPNVLYYQCTAHGPMVGKIYVVDAGIGTDISINTSGIITASSFVGDGSKLTGIISGLGGIGTAGGTVGTGITFLDFRGSGISSITVSSGIATITIPGASRSVNSYVAEEGDTSFLATYSVGYADVYLNGSKLSETEYTASNGTSIELTEGASAGDIVEIVSYLINITGGSSTPDISPVMMGMIF